MRYEKLLPGAVLVGVMGTIGSAGAAEVVGRAYDMHSGSALYTEHHDCDGAGVLCQVLYLDRNGSLIARKSLDYSSAPHAPSLSFLDFRHGIEMNLAIEPEEQLVVDAGFDNYIRTRWGDFVAERPVRFRFLVAGREKPLPMLARREPDQCTPATLCISVKLDKWLLGRFVPPIELTYDRESRRLLRFRGPGNLRNAGGGTQLVDIRYSYAD